MLGNILLRVTRFTHARWCLCRKAVGVVSGGRCAAFVVFERRRIIYVLFFSRLTKMFWTLWKIPRKEDHSNIATTSLTYWGSSETWMNIQISGTRSHPSHCHSCIAGSIWVSGNVSGFEKKNLQMVFWKGEHNWDVGESPLKLISLEGLSLLAAQ